MIVLKAQHVEKKWGEHTMAITMKAARTNADLTQEQAAEALGITKGTLASYELGKTIPKIDMAKRIARLYGFSVDDIIFFEN